MSGPEDFIKNQDRQAHELARLQSRLAEVEKERDELAKKRKDDQFECCVMSAITGREDGETLTMAVDRVCRELDKANQDLTALRALVVKKDEALKWIAKCGWNPTGTTTENAGLAYDCHCEAAQALALTPSSLRGMAVAAAAIRQGGVAEAGYEFANGKTEAYRKVWWRLLNARIRKSAFQTVPIIASTRK
jgi:hypothetical protein